MSEPNDDENGSGVATLSRPKVRRPSLYKVILLNDDYTTMDFVVAVLQKFFGKTTAEAHKIMLSVHQTGRGLCGVYPYSIGETKVSQVHDFARQNEMPLKCTLEKE